MERTLEEKVERAIKILRMPRCEVEIAYSGGKDSDVILELAKMAGIDYRAIYKNTTIDPPGTIQHCKDMGVEIIRPNKTFFQLLREKGYPNRRYRFCCSTLKEYKIMDKVAIGVRREESAKRRARYKSSDPIVCRVYPNGDHENQILPILDWTKEDVREFIKMRGIKCAPVYYDNDGNFCVGRRLGCLGCPLSKNKGLHEFIEHPNLVKAWVRAGQVFLDTHPKSNANSLFKDSYEMFANHLFFDSYQDFKLATDGMFGKVDCKQFLEDYFKIELK